jgi:hypothetical protein
LQSPLQQLSLGEQGAWSGRQAEAEPEVELELEPEPGSVLHAALARMIPETRRRPMVA